MNKTIWFINFHAAPIEEYYPQKRTIIQAQYFQKKGYDVKVFCSCHIHNSSIVHKCEGLYKEEVQNGVPFVFVKTLKYGDNNKLRILSYLTFTHNVRKIAHIFGKPDIIVQTTKIPFDYHILPLAKRIGCKYIIDVTDLWPAEIEESHLLSKKNPLLKWFYKIERDMYSQADHVVLSMEGCYEYLKDKKWDLGQGGPIDLRKIHYVNNGINLNETSQNIINYELKDSDLDDDKTYKVIYVGSIRLANNLEQLVDAAKILIDKPTIKFIIYGNGDERERLVNRCKEEGISNVVFKEKWIESKYVPSVISKANLNVLNYEPGWAPYGGSMNKMFMAFAVGRPIICNAGMRFSPIRDHQLGLDKVFKNAEEYAEAILSFYNMTSEQYEAIRLRSLSLAKEFDDDYLNAKFEEYCEL